MKFAPLMPFALFFTLSVSRLHSEVVAGPLTNSANGHFYYLLAPTFWTNAESQAQTLGGHLVTINDAAENAWVLQSFGGFGTLFIGFTDQGHEGTWVWTSGEPVAFVNWNAGEPNNGGGVFPYENYSMMYGRSDPRAGLWNDIIGSVADQQFYGVVEVAPMLSIRVSQVELCWSTVPNVVYQLQYRPVLTTNSWVDLGPPVTGTGRSACETDSLAPGDAQRFYRVVSLP